MDGQRIQRILRLAALPILLSGLCLAAQNGKPRCSAKLHGRFWPEQANSDAKLAVALARSGELEICSVQVWKYRWESLTVHISQLAKDGGQNVAKDRAAGPRTD